MATTSHKDMIRPFRGTSTPSPTVCILLSFFFLFIYLSIVPIAFFLFSCTLPPSFVLTAPFVLASLPRSFYPRSPVLFVLAPSRLLPPSTHRRHRSISVALRIARISFFHRSPSIFSLNPSPCRRCSHRCPLSVVPFTSLIVHYTNQLLYVNRL